MFSILLNMLNMCTLHLLMCLGKPKMQKATNNTKTFVLFPQVVQTFRRCAHRACAPNTWKPVLLNICTNVQLCIFMLYFNIDWLEICCAHSNFLSDPYSWSFQEKQSKNSEALAWVPFACNNVSFRHCTCYEKAQLCVSILIDDKSSLRY